MEIDTSQSSSNLRDLPGSGTGALLKKAVIRIESRSGSDLQNIRIRIFGYGNHFPIDDLPREPASIGSTRSTHEFNPLTLRRDLPFVSPGLVRHGDIGVKHDVSVRNDEDGIYFADGLTENDLTILAADDDEDTPGRAAAWKKVQPNALALLRTCLPSSSRALPVFKIDIDPDWVGLLVDTDPIGVKEEEGLDVLSCPTPIQDWRDNAYTTNMMRCILIRLSLLDRNVLIELLLDPLIAPRADSEASRLARRKFDPARPTVLGCILRSAGRWAAFASHRKTNLVRVYAEEDDEAEVKSLTEVGVFCFSHPKIKT